MESTESAESIVNALTERARTVLTDRREQGARRQPPLALPAPGWRSQPCQRPLAHACHRQGKGQRTAQACWSQDDEGNGATRRPPLSPLKVDRRCLGARQHGGDALLGIRRAIAGVPM